MARYLYSELAAAIQARLNCEKAMERLNPNEVSATMKMENNMWHLRKEWFDRWTERIRRMERNFLPSGSGIDSGTKINLDASHGKKIVLDASFHHMDENGYYDGWTEHTVTVTPGSNIRISGRNRNDIKAYLYQTFDYALSHELTDGEWIQITRE